MNAPARSEHLVDPQVELVPLAAITPSETQVQAERRKRYDPARLEELAQSIRENGVLQPIVVRPLAALRGLAKYELVAGERRWLAAERAGQAHILARILALSDQQVLQAQMVENLQREGLDTLAEAAGYQELLATGLAAEAIADMVGKSRSYVYARVQLLKLAPPVQEALRKDEIDASQALLFARIPTHKLQEQALHTLRKWNYQGHGEKLSFRRTAEILGDKAKGILLPLAQVPWQLDDASFWRFGPKDRRGCEDAIALPTCRDCPKRSGNDPELLAALGDANVCTDKECHDLKGKQTFERRRAALAASGQAILTGDAAAAILPTDYGTRGYVDLDAECDDDRYPEAEPDIDDPAHDEWERRWEAWKPRTYRQLLGADGLADLEITLVQDPKHKSRIRELAPDKEVQRRLKTKGLKLKIARDARPAEKPAKPADPEKARRQAEKEAAEHAARELDEKIENATADRVLAEIYDKWKGPLKRDDLELIADYVLDDWDAGQIAVRVHGKQPSTGAMNERDLGRLIVAVIVGGAYDSQGLSALRAMAKRLKIDTKAIEKAVRAELAGAGKAPAEKPKKKGGRK